MLLPIHRECNGLRGFFAGFPKFLQPIPSWGILRQSLFLSGSFRTELGEGNRVTDISFSATKDKHEKACREKSLYKQMNSCLPSHLWQAHQFPSAFFQNTLLPTAFVSGGSASIHQTFSCKNCFFPDFPIPEIGCRPSQGKGTVDKAFKKYFQQVILARIIPLTFFIMPIFFVIFIKILILVILFEPFIKGFRYFVKFLVGFQCRQIPFIIHF